MSSGRFSADSPAEIGTGVSVFGVAGDSLPDGAASLSGAGASVLGAGGVKGASVGGRAGAGGSLLGKGAWTSLVGKGVGGGGRAGAGGSFLAKGPGFLCWANWPVLVDVPVLPCWKPGLKVEGPQGTGLLF